MIDAAQEEKDAQKATSARLKRLRKGREVEGRLVLSLKPWWKLLVEDLAEEAGLPAATMGRHLLIEALAARGYKAHEVAALYRSESKKKELAYLRRKIEEIESEQEQESDSA